MNNNWRGRGGWRGGGRPWRSRGGGRRGRGRGENSNSSAKPDDNTPPSTPSTPPPKRVKRTTVAEKLVAAWKKKLPGYRLYFPQLPPQLDDVSKKIKLISTYLERNGYLLPHRLQHTDEKEYFEVQVPEVMKDREFTEGWPQFLQDLEDEPGDIVSLWGAVMHKLLSEKKIKREKSEHSQIANNSRVVGKVHAGIMKYEPVTSISRVNSCHLDKFVTLRGQIVGTGSVKAVCLQMAFFCPVCEEEFLADQPYGNFTPPKRCGVSDDCDNRTNFEPHEKSPTVLMMDSRKIKLQDVHNYERDTGTVPRTIECELTNGIVHQCSTGDTVTLTGIVKMNREIVFNKNSNADQNLHSLYIQAIAMRNHRDAERTMGGHWFSFTDKDYCSVRQIYDSPNLFKVLVASLCPSIYGHELVKAALVLSLFGGTPQKSDVISRRSDINILMIGDPGIGKSQMLKVITDVAPRGVYVCGTGSTVAGLTVTLIKEGDEYTLEAGALVMGDRGVCCIDEFDKMLPQHPALLEAMEQQSVSIAKSGVFRTLPARTTVIAAANPVGGHYDQRKSLSENVKISSPLLSRFDVTFILLDKPNRDFDQKVVNHIMGIRSSESRPVSAASTSASSVIELDNDENPTTLTDRLKVEPYENLDLIPHGMMRKYIAYARQHLRPNISPEAAAVLKEYYIKLRIKHRMRDSAPITTRQLESLLRLTEARAKLELREVATAADAKDILEIFESSLWSGVDDQVVAVSALSQSIILDTSCSVSGGSGKGSRNQAKRLLAALQKSAERNTFNIFNTDEIKDFCMSLSLTISAEQLIASLNNDGFLLMKGPRTYQLQTADY